MLYFSQLSFLANRHPTQIKEKHKPNNTERDGGSRDNEDTPTEDCTDLREEVKVLTSNFERLQVMYHQSLDELNAVKSEYEAKLIMANDNYRVIKTENEVLKEKVDILFKLGRSYLNNAENKKKNEGQREVDETEKIERATVEDREETEEVENLQEWTKNKLRGFKRVNPSEAAKRQGTNSHTQKQTRAEVHPPPRSTTTTTSPHVTPRTTSPAGNGTVAPNDIDISEAEDNVYRGRFCHFFVNKGGCTFEERTGQKCKYEHREAPMCNFGSNCSRSKCMFSHPKNTGNPNQNNFLGQMMNPWMNPWMSQNQNPWSMPNPWISKVPGGQTSRQQY